MLQKHYKPSTATIPFNQGSTLVSAMPAWTTEDDPSQQVVTWTAGLVGCNNRQVVGGCCLMFFLFQEQNLEFAKSCFNTADASENRRSPAS